MVDYLGALYDLVIECAKLSGEPLEPKNVFRAWVNRSTLPKGTSEYVVMTPISLVRRGTNVYEYDKAGEVTTMRALYLADVQVDFWSDDDRCLKRALALEAFVQSEEGVSFMRPRGVGLVDCPGGVRDMSAVGDADQYVRRAMVTVQMELWSGPPVEQLGTPGPLGFKYFENVDEHHPPIGE
jgi:hypothetical protein